MSKLSDMRDDHYRGVSTNDLDLAASVFSDDVVTGTPQGEMKSLEEFRAFGQAFIDACPDAVLSVDHTYDTGNTIITEGKFTGTHTGDLVGPGQTIPATGRPFSFPFVDVMTATNGKVTEHRIYWDMLGWMQQLGLAG
jgi:steroid delta-isomerase-like uncharacterized protein